MALKAGYKYSRYADDLSFSSQKRIEGEFLNLIQQTIKSAGFELKADKTRFASASGRMEVTGVVINEKMQPSRTWRKRARATLHKLGKARRLTRQDLSYLSGIMGMAGQFPDSMQMQRLSREAERLKEEKSHTVIGWGSSPVLPNRLTIRQAEALAQLAPRRTNEEISLRLRTTETAVKKRLQAAFKKIDASDRNTAYVWASKNL